MLVLHRTILLMKGDFVSKLGLQPNLLIVTPNEEMDLSAARIKVGQTIFGMRVIVSDTIDKMTVALGIQ